jgi:hypothetical protein
MKKIAILFIAFGSAISMICSCNNTVKENKQKKFPKPGVTVAEAKMPIAEDAINHSVFAVKVIADSDIATGVYDVDADFGNNFAETKFAMPKGAEDATPVIRKGSAPYTYIIGFKIAGDTTFYDYVQVSSARNRTKMEYINVYSF